MNFKIDVQGVWLDLCKSGLGAAYRARVCRLEIRSFARRLFGAV